MSNLLTRRLVCGVGLSLVGGAGVLAEPPRDVSFLQDFDELWRTLDERYCFFAEKRTDWRKVRAMYRPLVADGSVSFTEVVRRVLAELYDAHTHLWDPPDGALRWPLYDVVAERAQGGIRITAVQPDSAAALAGLAVGDEVLAIGGADIETAVRDLTPRCLSRPDPAADAYAINVAVAGRTGQPRTFMVRSEGKAPREVRVPLKAGSNRADLDSRRLEGGFGYVAIHSFAGLATIAAFDRALAELRDAPGLVIDVRGNGGGDTAVARPIMGRFISQPRDYAMMRRREGQRLSAAWTEDVEPRGPFTYSGPVVVLTDHWSGSMAEGFPMGMRDIGRARIVGTPMMGLGAAVFSLHLDRTGVGLQYSGEPVYDTQGRPRWLLRPDVEVAEGADILAAGVSELRRMADAARSA